MSRVSPRSLAAFTTVGITERRDGMGVQAAIEADSQCLNRHAIATGIS